MHINQLIGLTGTFASDDAITKEYMREYAIPKICKERRDFLEILVRHRRQLDTDSRKDIMGYLRQLRQSVRTANARMLP